MQLIDSHCHLDMMDLDLYDQDIANIIENGRDNGLTKFLNISVNLTSFPQVLSTAKRFDDVWATVGIHPCYDKEPETTVDTLCNLSQDSKVVAIGECGLDYYMNYGKDPKEQDFLWQRERFATHIQAANKVNKPLIVHTRDAVEDTIRIMQSENADIAGGIMHCYVEDLKHAQMAMEMNFMISFSGIVTFKSAKELQAVAKEIPDDRILIETDSPYLAPVPYRGKKNQPAYVLHVAEFLAELRGTTVEHIAEISYNNFQRLLFPTT